ncbi:substrate import-associated zinc metallohydrolase lipoprotein [Flammeovirga kamogawensis]|uniref:Substrate import-associated zinc metallohydrolase lipoprotein n=1 Tax=Flammeovirga kamogawensis TaxID=373891 RepID=A0ABX8H3T0_9BACT|nr:substrate import-associated zinc metallohydrolase lipoprotein [Flammeovirga kamogawensis]MBB6460170.1 substrate import-associated zinc metallohydrolase lipoprotein [Flammeovirga kamogawensis]QWG09982.1 hypothetical protein KM029_20080 [Flammeovirga kamogawensis]
MKHIYIFLILSVFSFSCEKEEEHIELDFSDSEELNELDKYLHDEFTTPYGLRTNYHWDANSVEFNKRTTPVKLDIVKPTAKMVDKFWIQTYLHSSSDVEYNKKFLHKNLPAELIYVGGKLYSSDGSVTLGYAESGARITLTDLNSFDLSNRSWLNRQVGTLHHEFVHILEDSYNLPKDFRLVTPKSYNGQAWLNVSEANAIASGFVTNYASLSFGEDYAETVSIYVSMSETDFNNKYNSGKKGHDLIQKKLDLCRAHYKDVMGIDLDALRDQVQKAYK